MNNIVVRNAAIEDAERLLEIYSYYVEHTAITFEYCVPTPAEFQNRMRTTMEKYPYLVVEKDGIVQGYAYAGAFIGRAAYDWSCETTIYLNKEVQKCGLGRMLYEALEERLSGMGILNLYACIGYPDAEDEYLSKNSAEFHEHLGFSKVGEFHKCGYKFDRWYNMIWMEKIIGTHRKSQKPVKGRNMMEHRVKVTVLDKKLFPELQAQYCAVPESGRCPCYNVGDEFLFYRNDNRDDYWHMGAGTLTKCGEPDEGVLLSPGTMHCGTEGVPFCSEAWDAISRYIYAALQGGAIMHGWMNDDKVMIACCNDGTRPVIFKIERIDSMD